MTSYFKVTPHATILRFPINEGSFFSAFDYHTMLFFEGKAHSLNSLVRLLPDEFSKAVSVKNNYKVVSVSSVVNNSYLKEVISYHFPYMDTDTLPSAEEMLTELWQHTGIDGEYPVAGAFLVRDYEDHINACFPVTASFEALMKILASWGSSFGEKPPKDGWSSAFDEYYDLFKPGFRRKIGEDLCFEYLQEGGRYFLLDAETEALLKDLDELVSKIKNRGIPIELLSSLFKVEQPLSKLIVTSQYNILLPDYNNMEIPMEPIQKALYLLFLKHPEGLVFKRLYEHKDEFLTLYHNISRRSDKEANEQTALRLLDPTNNSINEKCSRIKAAFLSRFDESIAKHYYITSSFYRTDPITGLILKTIDLDRSLVSFEG